HGPGSFMGELSQLSGRPSLVDAHAVKPVEALFIPPRKLRDVLVAEAELGERIMRALILRRVGLLQSGVAGPLIIGHAGDGDVLRLAGFLTRNGHPHHTLDPESDSCAKTLLERFSVDPTTLPIVLCPNGRMLRNPSEVERASARTVVIASGVRYRRLDVANLAEFEASSVHYWVSPLEGKLCAGQEVALVGAGNSAGQAVVYLASQVAKVWLLVRGPSLD